MSAADYLLVTNIFPPEIGGPALFIDRLAHALAKRDRRVTVVCSTEGARSDLDDERPFVVHRVDLTNRYRYEVQVRLRLALELARHDRILVNGLETYVAPIARRVRRRYVLKVVGDPVWEWARNAGFTTDEFDDFQSNPVTSARLKSMQFARSRYLSQASHVVTPSRYLAEVVQSWGVPADAITVIHNGVLPTSSPPRVAPRAPLQLVYCGRLTNWKGVETAILAVHDLDGVHLTIVGDGPEMPILRQLTRQLNAEAVVTFTGRLGEHEVGEMFERSDVLLLLSNYEGLSHTLLEACGVGVVPIVSAIGGNTEVIVDGESGMVVPYGGVAETRAAIERLRDPATFRRISEAAVETARRFSFDETVQGFVRLLEASR